MPKMFFALRVKTVRVPPKLELVEAQPKEPQKPNEAEGPALNPQEDGDG